VTVVPSVPVSGAVEGLLDEAVLRVLLAHVGLEAGPMYGKRGKAFLRDKINGWNNGARFVPWVVLVDLDREFDCAPPLTTAWLPRPAAGMRFRVAVRAIESWLLADRDAVRRFLGVRGAAVPPSPDTLADPKGSLVSIASRSRYRNIREGLVPRPGSGRREGPEYTSRLIEFATSADSGWRPDEAARSSESLRRCLAALRGLGGVAPGTR